MPRTASYQLHFPLLHIDTGRQMWMLYLLRAANELLIRLVVFYVPLFIFQEQEKFSLPFLTAVHPFQRGVILVALYYGLFRFAALLATLPLARLTHRFGVKTMLLVSQLAEILSLAATAYSIQYPWLLILSAVFVGFKVPLFWVPYNTLMSRVVFKRHTGEDMGLLQFLMQLISVIAPAIGGVLAITFGFSVLFIVGVILATLIVFIILEMDDYHPENIPSFSELKSWLMEKRYQTFTISVFGKYVNDVMISLWPLYVLVLVGSIEKVGYLHSLSIFLAMVITLISGFFVDRARSRKPFYISGITLACIWVARIGIASAFHVILVDTLDKLVASFHWLVYEVALLKRSIGGKAFSYYCYRELLMSAFGVVWWLFVAVLFMNAQHWTLLFIVAAVGVGASMYIRDKIGPLE